MKSVQRESLWTSYANSWGGWISRWLDLDETLALAEQIPQSWAELIANTSTSTITKVWTETEETLPRFTDYLIRSVLEVRVAESEMGYLLVYLLRDWREVDIGEYEDGFMMAGLPTPEDNIINFEAQTGSALPASLRTLWLTHGFIQRRDGTFITSLQAQQQSLALAPKFYSAKQDSWQKGRVLECLGIADVVGESVTSLTRQVKSLHWDDYLVDVMRHDNCMEESLRICIDDFLVDWTFSEWTPLNE